MPMRMQKQSHTVIESASGIVQGFYEGGARAWLGIPYASAERFAAPHPVYAWTGIKACIKFAAQCPQNMGGSRRGAKTKSPAFDENCLSLNIWAPNTGDDALKPVLVWIHGGAFIGGSGDSYKGFEFAERGDMVVVSINYRLGVLGFVNFGDVVAGHDIPSNLGLRDQIAALQWVQDNIAKFGGDPARVTIAGESAGSMSISLLMHCPTATPLFSKAILQSGTLNLTHSRETSVMVARKYVEALGLDSLDVAQLRALDLKTMMEAQRSVFNQIRDALPASPWFDGDLLPASLDAAHKAPASPIPIMAGANKDEIWLFDVIVKDVLPVKQQRLAAILNHSFAPEHAARILAAYPTDTGGRRHLASDMTFKMPTMNFAERQSRSAPTFVYRFDYSHPIAGATHALELAFLWPYTGFMMSLARGGPMTGQRKALADRMKAHWISFVKTGAPLQGWSAYDEGTRRIMLLNYQDQLVEDPEAKFRSAWNGADAPVASALASIDAQAA